MTAKPNPQKGMLLLAACTVLWSISGVIIKTIPWEAAVIAGFRSLIAAAVMALYIRLSGMRFRFVKSSLLTAVLMSGMFLTFVLANKLTTAANAIVIQSSAPVFVLLYNVLTKGQRARRLEVITVALTMFGIGLFFFERMDGGGLLGNAVALAAGVFLAATYIATCNIGTEERMSGILYAHLLTACIGIPFAFFYETAASAEAIGGIVLLGVVQLGIPYVLYGIAVQHCPPLACSLIGMLEAVFNPVLVFLVTGERPSALSLLGGALVLCTIAYWAVRSQQRAQAVPAEVTE